MHMARSGLLARAFFVFGIEMSENDRTSEEALADNANADNSVQRFHGGSYRLRGGRRQARFRTATHFTPGDMMKESFKPVRAF